MRTATIAALLIILVGFAIGIYLYPQMPDMMASHWNAEGIVDGYMSKFWGLFLMPLILPFYLPSCSSSGKGSMSMLISSLSHTMSRTSAAVP